MEDVLQKLNLKDTAIVRDVEFGNKIVIVDGQPGCGKTMLSPIVAALERVELLTFAYEVEMVCALQFLQKIDQDTAQTLIKLFTDLRIYNLMMSRETNFRLTDSSSVFRDAKPFRYLKRLFQAGDEAITERIKRDKPILHLTTHDLLGRAGSVFSALGKKLVFIEVVRHPLYMLKQEVLNMESLFLSDPRHFEVYFTYKNKAFPYFVRGWEDLYLKSNLVEKAIYLIESMTKRTKAFKAKLKERQTAAKLITVPFECFVIDPESYMEKIVDSLETKISSVTRRMMRKQNVPRKMYAEGVGLKIYKRCGWEPPVSADENYELQLRRQFAENKASKEAMQVLDRISAEYEEEYLGGRKK
ncbi:MAG: hypothetical protein KKH93_01305 [Candidatus Omnitrophica bacterium]|nr:hypothetical protein [Candidatus Omnitrophota bacterium]MBU2044082.1 hypothetical protein [Candidatus Omnitrophota bacterium]MBU2265898.1 hypothetical protein [Candidatus Omnitrophota bacterium]